MTVSNSRSSPLVRRCLLTLRRKDAGCLTVSKIEAINKMQAPISVNIATLKAHLSKYLRTVRAGEEVVVLDHKMPVARIIRIKGTEPLASTKPIGSIAKTIANLKIPKAAKQRNVNSLTLLLEERGMR